MIQLVVIFENVVYGYVTQRGEKNETPVGIMQHHHKLQSCSINLMCRQHPFLIMKPQESISRVSQPTETLYVMVVSH